MIPYAQKEHFNASEVHHFNLATHFINKLDEAPGHPYRCHELARAVGRVLRLQHQDGYYEAVQHTWLWTCELPKPPFTYKRKIPNILDVYVPGALPQVQLIDFSSILPARRTYIWTVPMIVDDVDETLVDTLADMFRADIQGEQ